MKIIPVLFATIFLFFNSTAYALEGSGKIVEVRSCALSNTWKNLVQFKLSDGNWFGIYAVHHGSTNNYNDTVHPAMVMMAFASDYTVNVKANYSTNTCGGVTSEMLYVQTGDYIHIVKD